MNIYNCNLVNQSIAELCGPNWFERWFSWKSRTQTQLTRLYIVEEIENLFRMVAVSYFTLLNIDIYFKSGQFVLCVCCF